MTAVAPTDEPSFTVELRYWDPESQAHIDTLVDHRRACLWDIDMPRGPWREAQRTDPFDGPYPSDQAPQVLAGRDAEAMTRKHINYYAPKEQLSYTLEDTCRKLRGQTVVPSDRAFIPVGHVALDAKLYTGLRKYNLYIPHDGSAVWIKSLWISDALRSCGVGRAAMDTIECFATLPPVSANVLLLDTLHEEDQVRLRGDTVVPNQPWYRRRGFRLIFTSPKEDNFYGMNEKDFQKAGCDPFVPRVVVMRKDLQ
ncbi:hypothetical protein BFJ72_g14797 [Fusarium proliferatum]|uniref:N-acetyltransferase domain-containing protein n=1 Tax=Gibberella intermedia TaxID=948311 RepID=A0A420RYC7_GIBIN|nr:hypothetical protein BFJ72_g14797 [Fusarium proliferatum]